MPRKAVRIGTLGGFSVSVAGRALRFGRKAPRRPLLLLKYLAARGGRAISAEQVARTLWPGRTRQAACAALNVTLHRLRRLVGRPEAIVHGEGRLWLDMRIVWCDAAAFEAMLDASARSPRRERRLAISARALGLYRGDFLSGEPRASWILAERARLRSRYMRALVGCPNL